MRLLVLEDNMPLSEAICTHLTAHAYAVDPVFTLDAANLALKIGLYDGLLIDLNLPDGDGLNLLIQLRQKGCSFPVIIMTARDQISERIKGLECGADDYLTKPFDLNEMIARIQAVFRRYEGRPNPLVSLGRFKVDKLNQRVLVDGKDAELSSKEWAVFEKLIARSNSVISKEQLEQSLYSFNNEIGSNTVEVYISRIRKKLGKDSIRTIRGIGYIFNEGKSEV
jgi:two-component system, OmpR family, response regulator